MTEAVPEPTPFSLATVGNRLRANWPWNVGILLVSLVAGVVVSFLLPVRYEARAILSPAPASNDRPSFGGSFAALGAIAGIDLSGLNRVQLRFYPELISSRGFLTRLAYVRVAGDTTIAALMGNNPAALDGRDSVLTLDRTLHRLRRQISVLPDERANILTITLRLPGRNAAITGLDSLLALVNQFDLQGRRLRATESRRFIEARMEEARGELAVAEEALATFQSHNRSFDSSPALRLAYERLQRQVDLRQQVYVTLAQSVEQARVEEFREQPLMTVVDYPDSPGRRAEPRRRRVVLLALALGVAVMIALAALPSIRSDGRG